MAPVSRNEKPYESPYSRKTPRQESHQTTAKRQYADLEDGSPTGDKRQKFEKAPSDELAFDVATMAAHAAAAAAQALGNSTVQIDAQASVKEEERTAFVPESTTSLAVFSPDPHLSMRILSLPILESLSIQILSTLAQGPYSETVKIVTQPDSELGQAYSTLKSLFDQTKKIYSQREQFLSAEELNLSDPDHRSTIRTTNLATYIASVFSGQDVGFVELNDRFIETFIHDGGELQMDLGVLFLNLKTQIYLSAVSQDEQDRSVLEIVESLFPENLAEILMATHPGRELTLKETEFLNEARIRREHLQNAAVNVESIVALSDRYSWDDFLRSLSNYLKQAYEPLIAPYMRRHPINAPPTTANMAPADRSSQSTPDVNLEEVTRAAAQQALQSAGVEYGSYGGHGNGQQGHDNMYDPGHQGRVNGYTFDPEDCPPQQSAPTSILYDMARQSNSSKNHASQSRRPGSASQRRPWTQEEEHTLMTGLDQVKGPHWSQILNLYGPGGVINNVLKDRNQVQLKDKARNLKLFFLKSDIEVPYYLRGVTGELRSRAPGHAARKDVQDSTNMISPEEQARYNGIMTLASGMQSPASGGTNSLPAHDSPMERGNSSDSFQMVTPELAKAQVSTTPAHPVHGQAIVQGHNQAGGLVVAHS